MNQILERLSLTLGECIDDMDTDEGPSAEWDPGSEIYIEFQSLHEKVESRIKKLKNKQRD